MIDECFYWTFEPSWNLKAARLEVGVEKSRGLLDRGIDRRRRYIDQPLLLS
jgi:hypothetical protein